MKKTLLLTLGFLLAIMGAQAQVIPAYSFESSQGTYNEITGGTVINTAGLSTEDFDAKVFGADGSAVSNPGTVAGIDIGFTFKYNNEDMTKFVVYTNGSIQLGAGDISVSPSGFYNNYTNVPNYLGVNAIRGVTKNESTEISYQVVGSAPNRELVIQWKNLVHKMSWFGEDNFITGNHQIRLSEADGTVTFVYGVWTPAEGLTASTYYKHGLGGGTSDNFMLISGTYSAPVANTTSTTAGIETGTGLVPSNGLTFKFKTPPPCQAPTAQPTGLTLEASTTKINGSFTATDAADHYLVVYSTSPITATPADGVAYKAGDAIAEGDNAPKVLAYTNGTTFTANSGISGSTKYYFAVFSANSLCLGGPIFLLSNPLKGEVSTMPAAPASLTATTTDLTTVKLTAQANALGDKVVIAQTDKAQLNGIEQMLETGEFGIPSGTLAVGSEIDGGGKVIFVGNPSEAITVEGLNENSAYFFRAWSVDANGQYSTTTTDIATATGGSVPYIPDFSQFSPYNYDYMPGWNDDGSFYIQEDQSGSKYIQCNPSYVDTDKGTEVTTLTPWIQLAEGTNRVMFDLNMISPGRWASPYVWNEDDIMQIQVSEDGETFTPIYTINDDNAPTFETTSSTISCSAAFNQFAGKKVRLRIYFKIFSNMRANIYNFTVEQKKAVDYPTNVAVKEISGGNVTLTWESSNDPAETDWAIRYKKSGDSEWSDNVNVSGTAEATLTGLSGLTPYEAQVCAIKGEQVSDWSKSVSFTTGLAIPFEDTFAEGNQAGWTTMHGALASEGTTLEEGGSWNYNNWRHNMIYSPYSTPCDDWLISPTLDLGDGSKSYTISYDIQHNYGNAEAQGVTYQIVVSKDNGTTWSTADVVASFSGSDIPDEATESKIYAANLKGITGKVKIGFYIHIDSGDPDVLILNKIAMTENEESGNTFDVTYAVQEGDTFTSGQTVSVTANSKEVATITYGEEGGADFTAGAADSHIPGFVAYTPGNGTNGNKAGGTFYTITPQYDGKISVGVVLNAAKAFYILEDGTALADYNGIEKDEKYYGTFDFDVKGGSSYKIYCAGSKLGFYGFNYTGTMEAEPIYIEVDLTNQFDALTNYTNWVGATGYATWAAPQVTTNAGKTVYMCEKYVENCDQTGDVFYQNLSGLTPGIYKIELYGSGAYTYGRGFASGYFSQDDAAQDPLTERTGLSLYAETSEGKVSQEIAAYKATQFSEVSTAVLDGVVVGSDGKVKLAMDKSTNYTNWHIVQLKGVTAKVNAAELYASYIAQATALANEPMNAAVLAQLQAAMADDSGFTTAAEYEAAIKTLSDAIDAANTSVSAYKNVKAALDEYAAKAESLDESGKAAYNVAAIQEAYDNRTLESDAVVADIKAAYVAAVKAQTTPGSDFTDAGSKVVSDWIGSTGTYSNDYAERFGEEMPADTIMHQTISGLPAGTYKVELYAVASQAWNSAATGNDITVAYANDGIYPLEVIAQVACDPTQSVATIEATVGDDGLLDMGMRNLTNGGNWFVVQLKSITLESLKPAVGEAIALTIESGKDISAELAAALANNPNPESISINLAAGGEYTVGSTIETAAPLTISGDADDIASIDMSALSAPMIAIRTTPYESTLDATNNFYNVGNITISNAKVKGLKQQLIYGNKVRAFIPTLLVENSIIEVAGGNKTVFDFNGGGVVGNLNINNSTIYGNPQHTGQLYSSQSGQKATEVSSDLVQKISILSSTLFNIAYDKNVNTHRQSNQTWLAYELKNSLIIDCGKSGQFVKGLNGGQSGKNPTWTIEGNSFQRIVDGAFTDVSANEDTGDEAEPISGNVEGIVAFSGDYTTGDFTLGACAQKDAKIGDPRWLNGANYYQFVATEWIAGDAGRISPDNVTANEADNTITVSQTGQNNVALIFRSQNEYVVPADNRYFVITATGLSTNDGDSYLWWLNNTNNGGQYKPTAIYEADGKTVFAWDINQLPIGGDLGKAEAIFKDEGGWSTTFGMTLADASVPAVFSYIGFASEIETPTEEAEYAWDATLWVAGDPGRITADKVSVDEQANTITVSQTGDNNVALLYQTDKVLYVTNAKYFVIQGKGLSTASTKSYLWWLNNTNNGTQVEPNIAVENADGLVTLVWTIADTGLGTSFEQEKTYLVGNAGWNTTFGLTLADDTTPAVISYIGYEKDGSAIVKEAQELADGIRGIFSNNGENGTIYNLNGQKVDNPTRGIYIINGKKVVVK